MKNKQNGKAWTPCKYLVIACFFLSVGIAGQAQRIASVSGNWSNTATWGGAAVPTAAQTVTINNGITVTVDIAAACNTLTTVNTGTLTISGTNSLAVTGLITMARPASNNTNFTIAVGAGSLTAGSLTMSATTTTRNDIISISTGTLTISGAITTGTTGCQFIFTGAGKMNIGGSFSNTPTLTTFSGSTVNYTALGVQTALATAYSNLTLSGSGVKTFATTPTVNGVLSMEGTATVTVTTGVVTYGTNATLQYNTATSRTVTSEEWISPFAATGGVIIANTGTITADGAKVFNASVPLIINSNATLATNNFQVTFGGNFVNDGMFTAGSSPIVIANTMAAQSIDGFTTTGTVSMTKTGGTATFAGNVNGGAFSLTGSGGILNLGTGLTHSGTTLTLAGAGQPSGSWGGPTSGATYINSTYFATATGVLNVSTSSCTTGSWLGTNSTDWNTASNWCGGVPTSATNVVIPSGGNQPVIGATAVCNNITINAGASLTISGSNTLTVSGSWSNSGTFTANSGTVVFNGAAQTVGTGPFNNLTLAGSGVKTTTGVTVNGVLSMEGTATASVAPTYGAAATLQYNTTTARPAGVEWITPFAATGGVIIANTGTITLNAAKVFNASVPLIINSNATLATNNNQVTFGGNFVNDGTFTAGSSPTIIANTMAAQSIDGFTTTGLVSMTKTSGTATFAGNVNGAGFTMNGNGGTLNLGAGLTHTFTGAWTRTNGTLNGGSSLLRIGGSVSGTVGTFTAGTGTVEWYATGAQTIAGVSYNNLTLSGSGAKTTTGATVNGILSMEGTATTTGTVATYGSAATLQYKGSGTQTTGTEFPAAWSGTGGVIIDNNSGVTLNAIKTISNNLTLTNGVLATGTFIFSPATVSRTNGWVFGNLQLPVATGSPTKDFYIGDAVSYTPVSLTFTSVTTSGKITATTTGSEHPNISTSNLNASYSANRYWTLSNNGTVFTSYSATFSFVAGDVDGGASALSFEGGLYSGSSWTYPILGARTSISTQLTGITGFGSFAIAAKKTNVSFTETSQSSVNESGIMTITAQLSAVIGQPVTVPFTVTGTATNGTDYTITGSPITIPAGSTTATATITIIGDALDEANETVIVTMGTPTNATQGTNTVHTATITDDDPAPIVSFTSASQSSANESGTMTVTVQLSAVSGQTVTVPFTVTGTATGGGTDYNISASPVTINAGNTTGTITITIVSDALDEADETVIVSMGTPTNATASGTTVHTAIITDDNAAPAVSFTTASQTSTDENGTMTITAQLSAVSGQTVTLPFTVTGTATGGGTDYAITASPVTIAAGSTTATITISIVDDALVEVSETVIVTMGTPTFATAGAVSVHTATIVDNDSGPPGSIYVNRQSPEKTYTPAQLVQNVLVQGCLTASNIVFTGAATQIGHFTNGTSSFPLTEGIILSTGKVADAEGPNEDFGTTTFFSGAGDANINTITGGTSSDAAVLEFDFVPAGNTIQFNYVFASEEYSEAVEANYNDAFAFLLSGPGITGTINVALIPSTSTAVSINTVHGQGNQSVMTYPAELQAIVASHSPFGHPWVRVTDNVNGYFGTSPSRYYYRITPVANVAAPPENASYYVDNGQFMDRIINGPDGRRQLQYSGGNGVSEMEYDGRTTVLTATHTVTKCQTYHIKMVIADVGDGKWDSGVFLEGRSFSSDNVQIFSQLEGLTGEAASMYEGCNGSYIRFQRIAGANNSQPMTFPVILAGTAQNGVDFVYTDASGTILGDGTFPVSATIPAGQNYADYYYKALSDGVIEGTETIIFKVNTSCPCNVVPVYFEILVNIIDVPQIQTSSVSVIRCESIGNPVATITVNMQNGLDPANYRFKLDGGSYQLSNIFTITSTQPDGADIVGFSHSVTVSDAYSCNFVTENNIIIPPISPSLASAGPDMAICEGQTGVHLNASGGLYYAWTSSPANGITYLSSTTIANPAVGATIPPGVYTFTVTTQNEPGNTPACQGSDYMVLTVNQKPGVIATANLYAVCNGTPIQLNTAVTNGGTSPTYEWFPTTDLSSSTIANPVYTPYVSSYLAQFFYVSVTGTNGCSINVGAPRIEVFPSPLIIIGTIINTTCGGSNGSATVSASSPGTSPAPTFTYRWDAAAGNQTGATATNLVAGIYTVTVTDAIHGCSATKEVTVGATPDITPPTAVCKSISINLDGTGNATITPADINNASTDNCTASGSLLLSLNKSAFNASNVGANTVTLTVTDAAGNSSTCTATVTVNYSATCNTTGLRTIYKECFGSGTVDGGYSISGGTSYNIVSERMRVTTNTNTGNFFLSRSINISSYTNLNISVSVPAQNQLDAGQDYIQLWYSLNGGAYVQFANNGNMSGTWTGTSCSNVPNGNTVQIIILSYQDGASEWREFDDVHLTGSPAMEAAAIITNVSCNGGNNGAINVTVTKGVTPYTYAWTTSNGSGLAATSEDQTGLTAGTYNLVVTDNAGVISEPFVFTVTQPAPDPAINTGLLVSDASACNPAGGNVIFTISNSQSGIKYELTTTGGVSLIPSVTSIGTGSNLALTLLQANVPASTTSYKVVATSASGCTIVGLTNQPTLTVTTTSPPTGSAVQSFCSTNPHLVSNLVVTGSGIKWYLAAGGGSPISVATNLVNGTTYYASQTGGGCESPTRLAVTVIVTTTPTILSVSHGVICGSGTVTIHATASSGTVNWYAAQTGGTALASGNDFTTPNLSITTSYWVDATNNGCTTPSRSEVKATVFPVPTITLGTNPSVCIGAGTASLAYSAITGGANQYSLDFDGTAEAAGFTDLVFTTLPASPILIAIPGGATARTYNANLTIKNNANSCSSNTYPISVTIHAATAISSQSTGAQTRCINGTFSSISVSAIGGNLTYQWYSNPTESNMGGTSLGSGNGAQTSVYTPQATTAGTLYYYCIVSGSCGSPATSAISGAFLVNPVTSITSQSTLAQTQCVGGTFSAISVTATGAGLTYQWYSNTSAVNSGGTQMDPSNGAQTSTYTPQAASAGTLYYYCIVSGTCGSLTSAISEAFLVNLPTTIISQSTEGQTRCIGGIFTPISVTATGVGLTYQWYSNTSAGNMGGSSLGSVNGSQTNTYTPQAGAAGTLYYYCIVSGTCGSVTSAISGPFVVNPATAINSQSTAEQTQCIGGTFTSISVTATGVGLTYQWYSNTSSSTLGGSSLNSGNGAQTNTYTPQATAAGTLYYYCIVSGTCGSATSAISGAFLVNPATAISSQSTAEQTRCIGGTFTSISVTATSVGLTYQWYSNTNASILGGSSLNADNGAQTSSYTPQATSVGTLYYYCIVSGTCGSATSAISGAFVVDPATAINSQSTAQQTRCIGGTFTSISVTATGVGLTYQWYSNASASTSGGSSLNSGNGAQTNTYTPQATAAGTLYFYCIISGTCGSVTSEISGAFLVNPATAISSQSTAGQTQCMGKSFNSISVTATGLGLTYQWYSNTIQSTIGGASLGSGDGGQSNTYTPQINAAGTLYYYCIVSGSCGSVTSAISGAFLVNPTPSATIIYTGSPYCYNAGFVAVYQTGTLGGSYSSAPAGLTLNAGTGEINTNASNPGSYTVTYTISPAGGCDIFTTTTEVSIIGDLIWTGSVSSDWNVSGNWFCGVIPDLTTNVHIPKVTNNPILSGGLAGAAKNIVIDNESSLTVEGNTIQISGAITNSGIFTATAGTIDMKGSVNQVIGADVFAGNTIMNLIIDNPAGVTLLGPLNITGILNALAGNLLSGGNLTLISTQTQTALIDGSGTGEVLGNATMQRYLPSAFGYKYFSSPFQTATVNEFADDMDLGALFPTFYMYNEKHLSPAGAEMSGWTTYTSPTGILNPLEGYAVNFGPVSSAKTADITGVVNNGSLSVNLWNHNSTYTLGYNLVGNPYPSPIDWNKPGWTKTNIDNAIYFFNAGNTNQYLGVYTSYVNGVSTGNGSNIIASMQGFFIHVADGTYPVSATFGVTNTVRTNDLNPLFKTAYIDDREILRFAANFETQNAIEDMAVVYFDRNATRSFEGDMDALKMTNTDILVPNLYSFSSESKQLSINGMPFPADSITKIPLGLTTFSDGWISFTAKDISRLQANMNIYLVDAEKGITQDLEQYPEYRFNLKAGAYNQRFSLVFSLSQIDNPLDITEKMFRVLPWNDILLVKVNLPLNTKGNLLVTNMGGQILLQRDVFEKETVEINPSSSSGVYIITVISGKRIQSEKLLMRLNYE